MEPSKIMLLDLLSNQKLTFFIPPYQRNYEWDESQCQVLLKDVDELVAKNLGGKRTEHFFGTIVFVRNPAPFGRPAKLVLTDGQQRITSTMLLLAAIRDLLTDEGSKSFIQDDYLVNHGVKSDNPDYQIKLKQVEKDWQAYRKIILKKDLDIKDEQSAVYKNYSYFKSELKSKNFTDEQLQRLLELGIGKLSVVTIELDPVNNPWENPQEIFESMNSLGKPLSLADLCRNYLLLSKSAEEQDDLYKSYWLEMEELLPDELSNFIRDYMQLEDENFFPKATEGNTKALYADFKELFKEANAEELFRNLKQYAKYYAMIVKGYGTGNNKIDRLLSDMQTIKATNLNPFLLGVLARLAKGDLSEDDVIQVLDVTRNYILRRRILQLTSGENKAFPLYTGELNDLVKSEDKKAFMFKLFGNQGNVLRLPNDSEVCNALRTMDFYSFAHKKFLLSLVEENISKSNPGKEKNVQVEHIMPRKLNSEWKASLGQNYESIHDKYENRLGNLTLIRYNQELGNKPFSVKKEIYQYNEGLAISRQMIIDQDEWGPEQIELREDWIISKIVQDVIPLPMEMKQKANYISGGKRLFSFEEAGLIGKQITYADDSSIKATVVGDREVEYNGKRWKLSPLTKYLKEQEGIKRPSGSYRGGEHWCYNGIRLTDLS